MSNLQLGDIKRLFSNTPQQSSTLSKVLCHLKEAAWAASGLPCSNK